MCGPESAWPALGTLEAAAPSIVEWARRATRGVEPRGCLAVVLLPGGRWYGPDPCRDGMQKVVDRLEQEVAETGSYPESLPANRAGACILTYARTETDFELSCSSGLRYSSLNGFEGQPPDTVVLSGEGESPEVHGLDSEGLAQHRELLDRIWQATRASQALEFHLEGAPLGPLAGELRALEGRCLSDRLELQAFTREAPSRSLEPSRKALLEALSGLPPEATMGLALQPGLLPRLPQGLSLTGLKPVEQRHLWEALRGLTSGALALGADWTLDGPGALARLGAGRAPVWGSVPLASNRVGMEFLTSSPVVHRRVELENLASARVLDSRLDLALGGPLAQGAHPVGEEVFPSDLPGEPGAAGWLELQRGSRAQIVRWAAGPQSGGLWLVASLTPGPSSPPEPPSLEAGQIDPDSAHDDIAWDADELH